MACLGPHSQTAADSKVYLNNVYLTRDGVESSARIGPFSFYAAHPRSQWGKRLESRNPSWVARKDAKARRRLFSRPLFPCRRMPVHLIAAPQLHPRESDDLLSMSLEVRDAVKQRLPARDVE